MTFLKSKKQVQVFRIIPLSISVVSSTPNSDCEYALQYKKQTTPFDRTFVSDRPDLFQLIIKTRKSSIRLFVLEKKSNPKDIITKRYKLRLKVQELVHKDKSEWKILSVTLKDGSKLELKSILHNHLDDADTQSALSEDDLSTIIMDMDDHHRETYDELALNIEEKEAEIKNLEKRVKAYESEYEAHRHELEEKDRMIESLRNKCHTLQSQMEALENQVEVLELNEKELRTHLDASRESNDKFQKEIKKLNSHIRKLERGFATEMKENKNGFKSISFTDMNPAGFQRAIDLYNHVTFIEQEIAAMKKLMDFSKMEESEKHQELIEKLRYYEQREVKTQMEKQQFKEFAQGSSFRRSLGNSTSNGFGGGSHVDDEAISNQSGMTNRSTNLAMGSSDEVKGASSNSGTLNEFNKIQGMGYMVDKSARGRNSTSIDTQGKDASSASSPSLGKLRSILGKKANPIESCEGYLQDVETKIQYSIESLQCLLEQEKNCVDKLDVLVKFTTEYLSDRIDREPRDRLLSDIYNPVMNKILTHLVSIMIEILSSGLTGPWRITRKNTVWDCLTQAHINMVSKNKNQDIVLSEEELNVLYSIRKIKKREGKNPTTNWEPLFRSWICIALNKKSLYTWLCIIFRDEELVKMYYDKKTSILFHPTERSHIDVLLQSLSNIPFALNEY